MKFITEQIRLKNAFAENPIVGTLGNTACKLDPFEIHDGENKAENTTRSYLQFYAQNEYTNNIPTELIFLHSVTMNEETQEFYFLASYKGRTDPDGSVVVHAVYEDKAEKELLIRYFNLKDGSKDTTRRIGNVDYRDAISAYCFGSEDLDCKCFYDFAHHPAFEEAVALHALLKY
ncbi:hypothetical protein AU074_13930 [Pseudomonas sp. ATCC PTA-122608]|uniref:hypothetical protein n=1 Tax=Pseudomonas sp. ATCC PTA-122608 TaxID=1771311 RepID=UPI00096B9E32|nr:hypothetical protein [Pseudomonas sp. ATCC PTA-122608]OLY72270.1 hypothetical protein AU074_13930 [Pseudomonas sp. ATCC PTA-122608]